MFGMLRSLWQYRNFVWSSIRNELKGSFARSKLGGLWMIINPLSQVAIYALVLSNVLAAKLPGIENKYAYAIYLMAGLLSWSLFNGIISRCLSLFIEQGNLMKKMSFPRITLPVIVVGTNLLNYGLLFIAMLGVFALLGHQFTWVMLWVIPLTIAMVMISVGIGLFLGVMNVFVRDIGLVAPIILQILFWFTPIVYPISIIPEEYHHLFDWNPVYALITGYQQILVYGTSPDIESIGVIVGVSSVLLLLGLFVFRRASSEMVDVL